MPINLFTGLKYEFPYRDFLNYISSVINNDQMSKYFFKWNRVFNMLETYCFDEFLEYCKQINKFEKTQYYQLDQVFEPINSTYHLHFNVFSINQFAENVEARRYRTKNWRKWFDMIMLKLV